MAAGHAATESRRVKGRVAILGMDGNARWSDLWRGNPHIASPEQERNGEAKGAVRNGSNCRPYLKYPFTVEGGATYTEWRARDHRAKLYSSKEESDVIQEYAKLLGNFILLEPTVKGNGNPNKQWGWERWKDLNKILNNFTLVQVGPKGTKKLPGIVHIETNTFRHACLVLAAARVLVAPEGGLHHAAGAMRKNAVVFFGGFVSPETTGYPEHRNLYAASGSPCGKWKPCSHCRKIMNSISPTFVARLAHAEYKKTLL